MIIYWITALSVLFICVYGITEQFIHNKRLEKIPIRVLVNGSRGKSTVTRLVAAALREHGLVVIARTTGAAARHILNDGQEREIVRVGRTRISEIMQTVKLAVSKNADALVVECMALQPEYQRVVGKKYVRSTLGVITNIREDHLDVMGPTLKDSARNLCSSMPCNSKWVTAEEALLPMMVNLGEACDSKVIAVGNNELEPDESALLAVHDIPQNYLIALCVCKELGVPRKIAWKGMLKAGGDPGSLHLYRLPTQSGQVLTIDAFSANDPDSTKIIMESLWQRGLNVDPCILIYNNRQDRVQRGLSFCPLFLWSLQRINIQRLVLVGPNTNLIVKKLLKMGFPEQKILILSRINEGSRTMEEMLAGLEIDWVKAPAAMLVGIGNKAGFAGILIEHWKGKGEPYA
jgi:gamma-polyglutamate synthase